MSELNLLAIIIIGIIIITASFFIYLYKRYTFQEKMELSNGNEEKQLEYQRINQKILELNEYVEFIKNELDEKHNELLFLYQLIDEKEIKIKEREIFSKKDIEKKDDIKEFIRKDCDYKTNIINLYKQGYTVDIIAEELNVGKGEVELIVNLYK